MLDAVDGWEGAVVGANAAKSIEPKRFTGDLGGSTTSNKLLNSAMRLDVLKRGAGPCLLTLPWLP